MPLPLSITPGKGAWGAFAEGAGGALNALAQRKLEQMYARENQDYQTSRLENSLIKSDIATPEQAKGLAALLQAHPQVAKAVSPYINQLLQDQQNRSRVNEYGEPLGYQSAAQQNSPVSSQMRRGAPGAQQPIPQNQQVAQQRNQAALQEAALLGSRNPGGSFLNSLPGLVGGQPQGPQAPGQQPIVQPFGQQLAQNLPQQAPPQLPREPRAAPIEEQPEVAPRRKLTRAERAEAGKRLAGGETEKPLTAAQKLAKDKYGDQIEKGADNLEDIYNTADRMLQTLDRGNVKIGVWERLMGSVSPSLHSNVDTEDFDKDAAHILNLTSQELGGKVTNYRVGLLEKEKPGLHHSIKENRNLLERIKKRAAHSLGKLQQKYPFVELSPDTQEAMERKTDRSVPTPSPIGPQAVSNQDQQQVNQASPSGEPGLLEESGGFAKNLGARVIEGAAGIGETPELVNRQILDLIGESKDPRVQELVNQQREANGKLPSERVVEAFGGEEALKPSNIFSEAAQLTAKNLPMLALTGGVGLAKLGGDYAGSLLQTVAKELGLGTGAQIGAGILGNMGFKSLQNKITRAAKTPTSIGQFKSDLYKKEAELGKNIKVDTRDSLKELEKLNDQISSKKVSPDFTASDKERALKNVSSVYGKLHGPKVTAADVFNEKKLLNEHYVPNGSIEGRLHNQLQGIVRGKLEDAAKSHPEWASTWKSADELHRIENWQLGLRKIIEAVPAGDKVGRIIKQVTEKNPTAASILSILSGAGLVAAGHVKKGATLAAIGSTIGIDVAASKAYQGVNYLKELSKTPDGQRVIWEIIGASANRDGKRVALAVNKLDKLTK